MRPEIVVQSGHTLPIADLAFSPDNQFVATAGADETVRVWDLRVGCEFRVLTGHNGPVYKVRYAPDGAYLASGGFDKVPILWESSTGRLLRVLEPCSQWINTLEFDRTGSRLLAASFAAYYADSDITLWGVPDGSLISRLRMKYDGSQRSQCVALSPDGATIAIFFLKPRRIGLYDAVSGQEKACLTLRDPERLNSLDRDNRALVFLETGQVLILTGEYDQPERIPTNAEVSSLPPRPLNTGLKNVREIRRMADGSLLLLGEERFERWDSEANRCIAQGKGPVLSSSEDGTLTAATQGRILLLNDAATGAAIFKLGDRPNTPAELGNMGRHYTVSANPIYPMIAAAAPDGHVRLWDLRSGRGPTIFKASTGGIEGLAFSPNGQMLATAGSQICIWDAWTAVRQVEIDIEEPASHLSFSPSSTVLAAIVGKTLLLVDLVGKSYQCRPLKLDDEVSGIGFEPGAGRIVVTSRAGEWLSLRLDDDITEADKLPGPVGAIASSAGGIAIVYSQHRWREGLLRSMGGDRSQDHQPQTVIRLYGSDAPEPPTLLGGAPYATAAAVSPNGYVVATSCAGGDLNVWIAPNSEAPLTWAAHPGGATGLAWTSDGRFLVSTGMDGAVRLWHSESHELVATLVSLSEIDYVIVVADGSYTATRGGLASVVFRIDGRALPFDQFDLSLNRPDRVLNNLGYAYHDLIDTLALAFQRRVQRMGVQPLEISAEMNVPLLKRLSYSPPLISSDAACVVRVQAIATQAPLNRLLVFINDVPYPDRRGYDLDAADRLVERELSLPLSTGANRIEISALDVTGTESLREVIHTRWDTNATGRLFILAAGISNYHEAGLSLQYAAKDAQDLAQALGRYQTHFSEVRTQLLVDDGATRDGITAARAFLQNTQVDDQVVIFLAGHGALFDGEYFFLPSDFNPVEPTTTGVSYDRIEGLLDGIAARRRLVLMDTCHAGEEDLVVPQHSGSAQSPDPNLRAYRHIGPQLLQGPVPTAGVTERALEGLFADLRRGAGAFVIAASGAAEFAVESAELRNGAFTHSIIEALQDNADHPERGGLLLVSELHRQVSQRVVQLTGGRQKPMSRRENLRYDFSVI